MRSKDIVTCTGMDSRFLLVLTFAVAAAAACAAYPVQPPSAASPTPVSVAPASAEPANATTSARLRTGIETLDDELRWNSFLIAQNSAAPGWSRVMDDMLNFQVEAFKWHGTLKAAQSPKWSEENRLKVLGEWEQAEPGLKEIRRKLIRKVAESVYNAGPAVLDALYTPPPKE